MQDLSHLQFDLIRSGSDEQLFRCRTTPMLLLVSQSGSVSSAARFSNELNVSGVLGDSKGGAPGHTLSRWGQYQALVIDDPGGELLSVDGAPRDIAAFLNDGIKIVLALVQIHKAGVIHGDIRPGNIVLRADGATFIGFGHSNFDDQTPQDQMVVVERLPYLSPDETTRSLSLDQRSDLYSLGVTLYEALTGRLPLTATTPLSWAHAHAARVPIAIGRWLPTVPTNVAAVVMKLISKAPEDRYQTATGLLIDLRECLARIASHNTEPFILGTGDARDHLALSRRVYGREREIEALKAVLGQVRKDFKSRIALVSGYSGIGKTRLVEAFSREIAGEAFFFARGKFDQVSGGIPYATLIEALGGTLRTILAGREDERARWQKIFADAVGRNGRLITSLIPEMKTLLGDQPEVPIASPSESQARFQLVMTRVLQGFAEAKRVLILFLDDLQWVDAATLELMLRIGEKGQIQNILLIGAYRDLDVNAIEPLRGLIELSANIPLGPLNISEVASFVADSLGAAEDAVRPLADAISFRTAGNPLYASHLLSSMVEKGTVRFDDRVRAWKWDLTELSETGKGDIVDLMTERIARLSSEARSALSRFAFIGNQASTRLLVRVLRCDRPTVEAILSEAMAAGLLFRQDEGYAFLHDRIQEAAYRLTPADKAAARHLELARILLAAARSNGFSEGLFDIVGQYNRGLGLIEDSGERHTLAELNLAAATQAEGAAAYDNAIEYCLVAASLLEARDPLAYDCQLKLGHCEWLAGRPEEAERRLLVLYKSVSDTERRGRVAASLININTAIGNFTNAVWICVGYMREQSVEWSTHPHWEVVKQEFDHLTAEINEQTIADRADLPRMTDLGKLAILDVLAAVLPSAFFTDRNFVCIVLCRMANFSREHGNGSASALAYAYLGMVLGPVFGDYKSGYEYGQVGLRLVQAPGFERYRGRVSMTFAYHVQSFNEPIRSSRPLLAKALEISRENGDLNYTGFCSCSMVSNLLISGEPLSTVAARAEEALLLMSEIGFGLISDIVTTQLQTVRCLQGLTSGSNTFSDGLFEQETFEARLSSTPELSIANCWHHIRKLQVFVHFGLFTEALRSAQIAEPLLWSTEGHLEYVEYHLYAALAKLRSGLDPSLVSQHMEFLASLAENCSSNFSAMNCLLSAEIALVEGDRVKALQLYDASLLHARNGGLLQIEALAAELLGTALLAEGMPMMAEASLTRSRDCYRLWGANAKSTALEARHGGLKINPVLHEASSLLSADVETVVRSSAAVAGESAPAKMLNTLMSIALEHAGAQRGLLLLPRDGDYVIEAEALARNEIVEVTFPRQKPRAGDRVELVMKAALMTNEIAMKSERFLGSAMAIPLIARGRSIGLLYLENSLSEEAFSPVRTGLLKLIAAQAAISLENASLEEKESLLKEVHHRVKNNLQLISSLLNIQASKIEDPNVSELFADSRNRVRSMALVHENLYRAGNFANVAMDKHIANLVSQLSRVYGAAERRIMVDVSADQIELDLDKAISCGLILNELVSNALKHAFTGERLGGQVRVRLVKGAAGIAILSVSDDGIGFSVDGDRSGSMGIQLVEDLTAQLHGKLEILVRDGTEISVTFPSRSPRGSE